MRFQNRRRRGQTGRERSIPSYSTQPFLGVTRRPFEADMVDGDPIFSTDDAGSLDPPIRSMMVHEAEATDPTRGGLDFQSRPSLVNPNLPPYTISNLTVDRTYDANSTSVAELADILGTLITDLGKIITDIDRRLRNLGA